MSDLLTMDKIWQVDDAFCFLRNWIYDSEQSMDCGWFRVKNKKIESSVSDSDDFHIISVFPNGILYTTEYKGDLTLELMGPNLKDVPGEDFACTEDYSDYVLLGDYLYRYCYGEGWQKTNISNGWGDLQWEVFQMPD